MNQDYEHIKLPNNWEIDSVLGQGSYGTVYRVKRVIGEYTEWAAVKHISMPPNRGVFDNICAELGTSDPDIINQYFAEHLQDLLSEYITMKSVQGHTNIVTCLDIQEIPKQDMPGYDVYIWMELLESLSARILEGRMDRTETIRLGMDICQALSLLKSKGIIHRDIKPQNLFVNDHGDYKLGDFGTAREIDGSSVVMSVNGTLSYMAPEIMLRRPAGFTSDIYSLGIVMYRLMNQNRHPFVEEGETNNRERRNEANSRRLSGEKFPMPEDADEALGRIILKACAYDPKERWQTPEEMHSALSELSEDTARINNTVDVPSSGTAQESQPDPQSNPQHKPKGSRPRNRKKVIIPVMIVLLIAAVIAAACLSGGVFNPPTTTPTPESESVPESQMNPEETEEVLPIQTPSPTPTPTPTPTPEPMPSPTPTPTPELAPATEPPATVEIREGEGFASTEEAVQDATPAGPYTSGGIRNAREGSIVVFGSYEQDGNVNNGQEPIEWIVLKAENGKALMISRYILDGHAFCGKGNDDVYWENSAIREWLNTEFLNTAFTTEEQQWLSRIESDTVSLAASEKDLALHDFNDEASMFGFPTKYAEKKVTVNEQTGAAWWWTRTKIRGEYNRVWCVNAWKEIKGFTEDRETGGVRPLISIYTSIN